MSDETRPERITLAVIFDRQERMLEEQKTQGEILDRLDKQSVATAEFRKAVTHQLWTPDGDSRVQASENRVEACEKRVVSVEECIRWWNLKYWGAVVAAIGALSGALCWTWERLSILAVDLQKTTLK